MAEARSLWRQRQPELAAYRLVFLDETGTATNLTRRHGRAPKGQRVIGRAPAGHRHTTTFLAGLTREGLIAPFVIGQPMNRAIFTQYVAQLLAPALRPGDIVILDNLSSHKGEKVEALIRQRGARLLFLPPYSPDLNPIEMAFAKLKKRLRQASERTRQALWDRIGRLLDSFSPSECQNYIRHAGYAAK